MHARKIISRMPIDSSWLVEWVGACACCSVCMPTVRVSSFSTATCKRSARIRAYSTQLRACARVLTFNPPPTSSSGQEQPCVGVDHARCREADAYKQRGLSSESTPPPRVKQIKYTNVTIFSVRKANAWCNKVSTHHPM